MNNSNKQVFDTAGLILSFSASLVFQFVLGSSIWYFCNALQPSNEGKKINVSLIVPQEEVQETVSHNLFIKEEITQDLELCPQEFELPDISLEDPFLDPMEIDSPILPEPVKEEKPKPKPKEKPKEKVELKKESEVKPRIETKIVEAPKTNRPVEVAEKKLGVNRVNVSAKPVLTKKQLDENYRYLAKIAKILNNRKRYPEEARLRRVEGLIVVSFSVNGEGRVERVAAKTAAPKILAEAAEKLVKSCRLPAPPSCWPRDGIIEIPISYKLH